MTPGADASIASIAAVQHGTFSSRQARSVGFTRGMVQSRVRLGRWTRVLPGVFEVAGTPPSWRHDLWIALHEAGETAAVSHRSAAALEALRSFAEGPIEVSKQQCRNHVLGTGLLHESSWLPADHVTVVDGFPCTTVERTIFDLAAVEPERRVVRALDDAVVLKKTTPAKVAKVLDDLGKRGRPGTRMVRRILASRSGTYTPTESGLEQRMVDLLEGAELPAPERQVVVWSEHGFVARVDLAYPRRRLAIEVDGERFHTSPSDRLADELREERLRSLGWEVLRVTGHEVWQQPERAVARVRRALAVGAA